MHSKEKVKDFNKRFLTILNKIPTALCPTNEVIVEFYLVSLLVTPSVFIKRDGKVALKETSDDQEIKVTGKR